MNLDEDTTRVRELLAHADPVHGIDDLDDEVAALRVRIANTGEHRWARVAAAAVVALLVAATLVPMARPPSAWAIEDIPEMGTVIRVELPGALQRGPDPSEVVAALRDHGVAVEVVDAINIAPWKVGRTIGIGFAVGPALAEGFAERFTELDDSDHGNFIEVGITTIESGGFLVHPDTFEGTVTIQVGRLPLQDPGFTRP